MIKIRMPSTLLLVALASTVLLHPAPASAQGPIVSEMLDEYWQQRVDYDIRCVLDTDNRVLAGEQTIRYRNNSPDTLRRFYLHLYPNAWRDKDSQLYRDFHPGTWLFVRGLPRDSRGWIDIESLTVGGRPIEYSIDGTILEAAFPAPLPPGGEAEMRIDFTLKIRRRIGRAGYLGRHYDMAQWYPKLVVYDKLGWHPDQFRIGEFYGEFGTYRVSITLPEEYVVVATGVPVDGDPGWSRSARAGRGEGTARARRGEEIPGGSRGGSATGGPGGGDRRASGAPRTVTFLAENVHDFAWSANPDFVVEEATRGDTRVLSVYRSWNTAWADSVLARTLRALAWFEQLVGPYQWPQLAIVDSPTHGGMEYPMLVMNGSPGEALIVHEVAHMWFYGMLANNERAEAWLDEGPAQYFMFRWIEERSGHGAGGHPGGPPQAAGGRPRTAAGRHPGGRPPTAPGARPGAARPRSGGTLWDGVAAPVIRCHREGFAEPMATPYHEFEGCGRALVYNKGALFFRALRHHLGDELFHRVLRTYFELWKFKHVDGETFLAVAEDVTGLDLRDFYTQWVRSAKDCDYALERFRVRGEGERYEAEVRIARRAEKILPLTLVFGLENGETVAERLDGRPREIERTFIFESRPLSAHINPGNEILDIYALDNRLPRARRLSLDRPGPRRWPPYAYQYYWLPLGWYNDVDGGKAGLRLRGGYDGMYRLFTLQGAYGFESDEVDFYGRFERPVGWLGRETTFGLEGFRREGRQGAQVTIDKVQRKSLKDPLPRFWQLRLGYHELTDEAYVPPGTYAGGDNFWLGVGLSLRPRADIFDAVLKLDFDRSTWGSAYRYERMSMEAGARASARFPFPLRPALRLWYGNSANDPPPQSRYNLAGAGVLEKERYFWLRSVGAFPRDYYANFRLPGHADLRGYYGGDYPFKRLAAVNAELDLPFPLPGGLPARLSSPLAERRLYLFFDAGAVLDKHPHEYVPSELALGPDFFDEMLRDFGLGIKLWRLTAEFPLWLSHPALSGEQERWNLRWTIGFETGF